MSAWHIVSETVGWLYVIAWGLVAYPQLYLNFKLKSVEGFKIDYPFLNLSGFSFYAISTSIAYFEKNLPYNNYGLGTVRVHDVIFAFHNLFLNILLNLQVLFYKRGANKLSLFSKYFILIAWLASGIIALSTEVTDWIPISQAFNVLMFFGYLKIAVTLIKYAPLVYWNYVRKSTVGFSIYSILFDILGGFFSISQLVIDYYEELTPTLNPIKMGLGIIVVFYDIIIIYQHYFHYRKENNHTKQTSDFYVQVDDSKANNEPNGQQVFNLN